MQDLFDMLTKLGPGWMAFIIVGTLGGAVAYVFSHRQYLKMVRAGHEEQLALKDETIKLLNASREQAINIFNLTTLDLTKERDVYRDRLHEERASHQASLLKLAELESRPDLSKILTLEKELHQEKMKVQEKMLEALVKLEDKIDDEHKRNANVCNQTAAIVGGVVKYLSEKGILPADFKPLAT